MGLKELPKRGEVYFVCLDPTVGAEINKTRPALVVSNDINNQMAQTVTVIPITSATEKVYPFEVFLSSSKSGLTKDSKVKCNQIRTVDKKRLVKRIGSIASDKMKEIESSLCIHLGMDVTL